MPLDGLCLELFREFSDFSFFFKGGSVRQIICREHTVFRSSNISCSLAIRHAHRPLVMSSQTQTANTPKWQRSQSVIFATLKRWFLTNYIDYKSIKELLRGEGGGGGIHPHPSFLFGPASRPSVEFSLMSAARRDVYVLTFLWANRKNWVYRVFFVWGGGRGRGEGRGGFRINTHCFLSLLVHPTYPCSPTSSRRIERTLGFLLPTIHVRSQYDSARVLSTGAGYWYWCMVCLIKFGSVYRKKSQQFLMVITSPAVPPKLN